MPVALVDKMIKKSSKGSSGGTGFQPVKKFRFYRRNLPHVELPGHIYFITFSCASRFSLLSEARDVVFDSIMFHNNKKYKLYACVVLPDHVHLILQPSEKSQGAYYSIAEIMHSIKSYSANKINRLLNRVGAVWLDENFDRVIRDDREFLEKMGYITGNPLKLGLVEEPEHYKWLYVEGWVND